MNSENSKTSDPHRLLLNISDKIDFKWSDTYLYLSNLSMYYTESIQKCHSKTIHFKCLYQHRMKTLNYQVDHILY